MLNAFRIQDLSTRKAAMANLLATSQVPFNSYLLHRRFHFTSEQSKTKQLFSFQAIPLRYNALVLDLLSFKFDKVARSISSLHPSHSNLVDKDRNALFVLLSAAVAHNQDGKAGLKRLLALLKQRPTDLGILLTVIQFYCVLGNKSTALALLKACLERFETKPGGEEGLRYAPGLVATLVALYSFQGRRPQIKLALKEAASFWRGKPRTHSSSSLLKAAGITLLSSSKQSDLLFASELLRDLHQQNGSDDLVAAGFTVACAATASEISRTPELDDLASIQSNAVSGINAVALEEGGVLQAPHARGQTMDRGKRRKGPEKFDGGGERKPKRIRKSRLPKDYDPNRVPNPERWLPLQDRSTYKLKGKKNKARMVGSTQGGDALDSKDKLSSSGGAVVDLAKRRGKRDKSAR
jgi:signal recognition particle subunit SRP72